jgi:hypothetical protein
MGENVISKNPSTRRAYVALAVTLVTFASVALAATFPYFSPATGILKGNANSYVTTAAASSDVIGLWSGTCNGTTALRGDGTCGTLTAGTVTSVGLTMPSGFSVVGSPVTSSGTLAVSTTLNGLLKGNGSGFTTALSSDVISLWTGTCNASSVLKGDGSCGSVSASPAGNNTDIQYNASGAFGAEDAFAYDPSTNTLTAGDTTTGFTLKGAPNAGGNSRALTIIGGQPGATNIGGGVIIDGGPGGSSTGFPGSVTIRGGTPVDQNGATVSIVGSAGVGTNRNGGGISLSTGAPTGSGAGGSITLATGGTGGATGGQFSLATGGINRLVIGGAGDWQIPSGTPGISGQVLTSNGTGTPPTWQTPAGALSYSGAYVKYTGSATTFSSGLVQAYPMNAENDDTGNYHDNATNNSRVLLSQQTGRVQCSGNITVSVNTPVANKFFPYSVGIRVNGSTWIVNSEYLMAMGGSVPTSFFISQNVQTPVFSTSAGTDYAELVMVFDNTQSAYASVQYYPDNGSSAGVTYFQCYAVH